MLPNGFWDYLESLCDTPPGDLRKKLAHDGPIPMERLKRDRRGKLVERMAREWLDENTKTPEFESWQWGDVPLAISDQLTEFMRDESAAISKPPLLFKYSPSTQLTDHLPGPVVATLHNSYRKSETFYDMDGYERFVIHVFYDTVGVTL